MVLDGQVLELTKLFWALCANLSFTSLLLLVVVMPGATSSFLLLIAMHS